MNIFDVVRQVRNNAHDPNPPVLGRTEVLYPDQIYVDKIYFALNKLNMDLRNLTDFSPAPPWNIATVPTTLSFLLLKLATIEMAQIRGAEAVGISMVDSSTMSTGINHVTVPDLTVIENAISSSDTGPGYWKSVWKELQKEYDGEIARLVGKLTAGTGISCISMTSRNMDGSISDQRLARKLPATTVYTSYMSGVTTISWTPVYSDQFAYYIVYHTDAIGNKTAIKRYADNHIDSFEYSKVLTGTNYFSVSIMSMNHLETESATSTVTV